MNTRRSPHLLTATALAASLMLAACGGGSGDAPPPAPGAAADTTGPVITITDSVADTTAAGPVTFTFNFNEDVGTSFTVDDITVAGGTKGAFERVSGTRATLLVTPAANSAGTIMVSVAANGVVDARGNPNAATSSLQAYNTVPPGPAVAAAAPPARAADNVLSVYSDTYTAVTGVNVNPDWGQATRVTEVLTAGNKTLKYAALNYQGTDWSGSPINVSAMTRLHLDVWTADVTSLKVSVISAGKENAVTLTPTLSGWNSFDIDMAQFTAADKTAVVQLKIEGTPSGTVYLDNIYFWKEAAAVATGTTLATFDEATAPTFAGFDGGEGSAIDPAPPAGGSGKALKILRSGGQVWAGAKITVAPPAFSATEKTISARVYAPAAGRPFVLKMEGPGIASAEVPATQAVVAGWQTLSWVVTGIDLTKSYPDIVFLPNLGTLAPLAGETYYVDDVRFSGSPPAAAAGALMVSFDEAPAKAFVGFDGGEGSSIDAAPPAGGATGKALRILRSGGQVWAGAKVTTAAPIFTATNKTITAKVYSPKAGARIVLKMEGAGIASAEVDAKEPVVVGWQTLSWDITGIDITKSYPDVVFLPNLGTLGPVAGESYYFDDVKFLGTLAAAPSSAGAEMGAGGAVTMAISTGDAKGIFAAGEAIFAGDYIGSREPNPPNNLAGWPNARTDGVVANGSIGYYNDALLSSSAQKLDEGGWVVGTSLDAGGTPNFFRYFVLRGPSSTFASSYLGLFANAPNNGTVNVSSYANLKFRAWGPAEQYQQGNLNPVLEITLSGPKVTGCTATGSGGTEIGKNLTANLKIGAGSAYKVGLASGWTVKGVCGTDTNATAVAAVLAKLSRVAVTVPASSFNWVNANPGATPSWSSGLNLGPIGFTNAP